MAGQRLVKDIMVAHPRTVPSTATAAKAFELMLEGDFRHLPVVDGERVVGIVSDRDILQHMPPPSTAPVDGPAHGRFARKPVGEIMSHGVLAVNLGDSVDVAVELMLLNKVSALVVTDSKERLQGIVTLVDIAKAFLALLRGQEA